MPPLVEALRACRACKSPDLAPVFGLGPLPISDFPEDGQDVPTAPLDVVLCGACGLSQLSHTVDRDALFGRHYWYRSGVQPAMVDALRDVATSALRRRPLAFGDVVLDIGANDGTLLAMLPDHVTKLAYEPAANLWPELHGKGIKVAGTLFPTMAAGRPARIENCALITSIAMFYSVADPDAFVAAIAASLALDGLWVNQMAYLPATLATNNVGDLCHEHLTYWTIQAFHNLLDRHGLTIEATEFNDVNGGSVRVYVRHGGAAVIHKYDPVGADDWQRFRDHNWLNRTCLRTMVGGLQPEGVYGYGASTKGNTMLAAWNIGPDMVTAIADRNPEKVGRRTVTGIPIVSEETFRRMQPKYALVLPFHFLPAFVERERAYLADGGRFLVPLPTLRIVGGDHAELRPEVPAPNPRADAAA